MKKFLILTFFISLSGLSQTQGYLFGLKSSDNSIENIVELEKIYSIHIPVVAFLFDQRGPEAQKMVSSLPEKLGTGRIYHLTLSPASFSAEDVAAWAYDYYYQNFFETIKKADIKVAFRTMHEMNGWRYSRSSKPASFKKARKHVWNLSRKAWLTQKEILFVMSVNHVDMPTFDQYPSQTSTLVSCNLTNKRTKKCPTFEDYYPGSKFVDIIGITFYNRWKWNGDKLRLEPEKILYKTWRVTLPRLKNFWKPILIDEVATTAVWYKEKYSFEKSLEVYQTTHNYKNNWLISLRNLLLREPQILGAVYFNKDFTNGLTNPTVWELDRKVLDLDPQKTYKNIFLLFKNWEKNIPKSLFYAFFSSQVPKKFPIPEIKPLLSSTQKTTTVQKGKPTAPKLQTPILIKDFWFSPYTGTLWFGRIR